MEILILSKTKYGLNHVCVGGLDLSNNQYLRLMNRGGDRNPQGWYQFINTPLNIGEVWDIDYVVSPFVKAPHVEDVFIVIRHKIRTISNLSVFLSSLNLVVWAGNVENLYDGKLSWTKNGKGYLSESTTIMPNQSVGFWISDNDVIFYQVRIIHIHTKSMDF
jgi:hypothetical protein